jgi:hypothetical protein
MVIQSYPRLTVVSLALSLELALSSILPAIAISPSTQQQHSQPSPQLALAQRRSRLRFKVPGIRPSRNLEGGAARGGCGVDDANKIQMKALLPDSNIGLTTTGKPTFFFQISPTSVEEGKFILLDATGDTIIYEKTFPLRQTGGVMSFTLPADADALEVGKEYTWELVLNCDPEDQRGNPRVEGSIKRLQPSQKLASDIARIPMRDRAGVYAEAGYWYDSLKTLADLRSTNPNDSTLINDWNDLLESAGLSKLAKEPLL